jgi:hypothetical protein
MKKMMSEYGGKEKYKSKGAMKRHEGMEKPKIERMERMRGYRDGGMVVKVKGKNC